MNNSIIEIKNTLEGTNTLMEAEEWISELEHRMMEITAEEQNNGKKMKRIEDSLRVLWDNIKCKNFQQSSGPQRSITTNKASAGDGIPAELFQTLKDDAVKSAALNMPANLENSAVATGVQKVSFIPIPKKGNAKECSNYCTIALI